VSNKYVMVIRVQAEGNCQGRAIIDTFHDIPGFPEAVSDDAGNAYTLDKMTEEYAAWHSVEDRPPSRITMTFAGGDKDMRVV
jgi:hypothetical protein